MFGHTHTHTHTHTSYLRWLGRCKVVVMLFGVMSTFYSASLWGQSDGDPWVYGPPQNDTCHFNSIDVSTKVRLKTKDLVYFKFREATGSNFHFTTPTVGQS